MASCDQCGKPAIVNVAKHPLCVGCYALLQQTETAKQEATNDYLRLLSAQQNHALAQMDAAVGIGIGRSMMIEIPRKAAAPQYNTIHSVSVQGSTVGAINTGEAHSIAVAIGATKKQGNPSLAEALRAFTDGLTNASIPDAQKREMAEQLGTLSEELTKSPQARRRAVVGPMLEGLSKAVTVSTSLIELWSKLHPLLTHALQ